MFSGLWFLTPSVGDVCAKKVPTLGSICSLRGVMPLLVLDMCFSGKNVNTIVLPQGEKATASRQSVLSCRQCKGRK